ncbi:MAG: creatininase family protein [Myxococcales bacterium]|nr:creatininase family protein [Myxococcales bacterium]
MTLLRWNPQALRPHLRRGVPVYLPVNPVEYHGPHLSLHNDHLVSVGLARDMHAALQERLGEHAFLLAQDLGIGVDPCPGPGSEFTSYPAARRRVVEAAHRLADLGAERVVLITFHGSPLHGHALHAGVRALTARGVKAFAPLTLALEQQMQGKLTEVEDAWLPVHDPVMQVTLQAEAQADFHAGFIETSLALHYAPEHVEGHRELPPCPPPTPVWAPRTLATLARALGRRTLGDELEMVARGLAWYGLRPFPGYTGRPDLANPESGAVFARALTTAFAERALQIFTDQAAPSAPPLAWLPWVSLGGRIGGLDIPEASIQLAPLSAPP